MTHYKFPHSFWNKFLLRKICAVTPTQPTAEMFLFDWWYNVLASLGNSARWCLRHFVNSVVHVSRLIYSLPFSQQVSITRVQKFSFSVSIMLGRQHFCMYWKKAESQLALQHFIQVRPYLIKLHFSSRNEETVK